MRSWKGPMSNSSTSSSDHEHEDIHSIYLVTAVYLCLLAALGSAGNTLVVATVMRMPQLHRSTYILVANLSAVGLLNCLLTIPMHVAHTLLGPAAWGGRGEVVCRVQAHINFGLILSMLVNSTAIAVCRYKAVYATHNIRGQTQTKHRITRLIFFSWVFPVLVAVSASPFLGFNPLVSDCFFVDMQHAFWYMNAALAAPALASTLCMMVIYSLIIKKVRDSRLKISHFGHNSGAKNDERESQAKATASDSEACVFKDDKQVREISSNNKAGIAVFTTMVNDQILNIPSTSGIPGPAPSTSDAPDQTPSTSRAPDLSVPHVLSLALTTPSTASPDPSKQASQLSSHLQPPVKASPSSNLLTPAEGMDSLSIPSRASSGMSGISDDVTESKGPSRAKRQMKREVRLTLQLLLAFILFCLLYLPLCLAHLFHAFYSLRKEVWLVFYTLALSFASNAWLVYALLNKEFRRAFRALLSGRRSF